MREKPHTQTLQHFVKILPEKKGIEKNLWAKKFIKNINYSKDEIALTLYLKRSFEDTDSSYPASGWVRAASGRNSISNHSKKTPPIQKDKRGHQDWLM